MPVTRPEPLTVWHDLCAVADAGRVRVSRALQRRVGLSLAENLVLCHVAMAPGGALQMAALSESLSIGKSAVTKTVDRLEARGLLTRRRDTVDRRAVYATVTAAGAQLFRRAQPAFAEEVSQLLSSLNATEIRDLRAALDKLRPAAAGATG